MRDAAERVGGLTMLAETLRTDIDWMREHTRLGELASRCEVSHRPPAQLWRGDDIAAAVW